MHRGFRQAGLGLIEVVLAVGLLSLLGYGLSSLINVGNRSASTTKATTDFNSLVSTIQGLFNNSSNCAASLGAYHLDPSAPFPQPVSPIRTGGATGAVLAQLGSNGSSLTITNLEFSSASALGATN